MKSPPGRAEVLDALRGYDGGRNIALFEEEEAPAWTELEAFCLGGVR